MKKFDLSSEGTPNTTFIYVDGKEVKNVSDLLIRADAQSGIMVIRLNRIILKGNELKLRKDGSPMYRYKTIKVRL